MLQTRMKKYKKINNYEPQTARKVNKSGASCFALSATVETRLDLRDELLGRVFGALRFSDFSAFFPLSSVTCAVHENCFDTKKEQTNLKKKAF